MPELIVQLQSEHPAIKKIVLCGGMVNCPGLVERLKKELKEYDFEIVVDEFLMWKSMTMNTDNVAEVLLPPTVG